MYGANVHATPALKPVRPKPLASVAQPSPLPPPTQLCLAPIPQNPLHQTSFTAMTQHNSFKSSASSSGAKRNVLKRFERVELLKKRNDFKGGRVTGLRKTKPDA